MLKAIVQQVFPEKNKVVMVGLVPFADLLGRVRLSYRRENSSESDGQTLQDYQRQIDQNRVVSIAKYIVGCLASKDKGGVNVIFPNSIILACALEEDKFDFETNKLVELNVPIGTMVVDGQHRFAGLNYLYENAKKFSAVFGYQSDGILKFIDNYRFNCSVLLNFDMWEQAQIFANVNFNQKKVNKSLFYDIYGVSIPLDDSTTIPRQNEIYLAHELVVFLDSNSESVFKGFVKMLGKGSGYVSQAFLVEALMRHLSERGIWSDAVEMQKYGDSRYNYVAHELTAYLAAIRFTFRPYWPDEVGEVPKSVLCKTSGIGALLRLLETAHNNMTSDKRMEMINHPFEPLTYAGTISYFTNYLEPLKDYAEELFSLDGKYASGAGSGMQSALYKRMLAILNE